jgi:hypothetical protein
MAGQVWAALRAALMSRRARKQLEQATLRTLEARNHKYMLDKGLGEAEYATLLDQYMKGQVTP